MMGYSCFYPWCNTSHLCVVWINKLNSFLPIFSLPWNWKAPVGFVIAAIVQFLLVLYVDILILCDLLCMGLCQLSVGLSLDIQCALDEINNVIESSEILDKFEMKQKLNKIIEIHSIALRWSFKPKNRKLMNYNC